MIVDSEGLAQTPPATWSTSMDYMVVISAVVLGLSVLATLYPSWRASRIDPVEALRYE